eukprot:2174074-Pyramimonas_sp.AAC.1
MHASLALRTFDGAPYGAIERVRGVPEWCGTGGAPYGTTKRVKGVPKWCGQGTRTLRLGPQ